MEFTPINTQEEFDARVTEVYGDVASLQQQVSTLTGERDTHANTIAQLQQQVKGYEISALKQRIALEKGIPIQMADRLAGDNEKDIRKDAEAFAKFVNKPTTAPGKSNEPAMVDGKTAAFKQMLNDMKGE